MLHFRIRLIALSFALSSLSCIAAQAQGASAGATAAAPTKVGIVSIQDAIVNTNEGKKEFDALQQRFGPKNNELRAQNDEVEKLKTQLQAQADKLNETARASQVKTISEKQKSLQRRSEDFQAEVQNAEQDIVNRLGQKMLTVLEKYAKDNGYDVILDVSSPQTPVLWASTRTNLTKELVDAYNAANPAIAPAAAKPAGATTPKKP
ncbi:MAG TPA: OmpH family outer membrane protein [Alphaproteobacteria bacterium]|nr:OmpH family outer membrane protein [Alphaproteobacteria bacterium]